MPDYLACAFLKYTPYGSRSYQKLIGADVVTKTPNHSELEKIDLPQAHTSVTAQVLQSWAHVAASRTRILPSCYSFTSGELPLPNWFRWLIASTQMPSRQQEGEQKEEDGTWLLFKSITLNLQTSFLLISHWQGLIDMGIQQQRRLGNVVFPLAVTYPDKNVQLQLRKRKKTDTGADGVVSAVLQHSFLSTALKDPSILSELKLGSHFYFLHFFHSHSQNAIHFIF